MKNKTESLWENRDTILDRTQMMNDAKRKKSWNMTWAEKDRTK